MTVGLRWGRVDAALQNYSFVASGTSYSAVGSVAGAYFSRLVSALSTSYALAGTAANVIKSGTGSGFAWDQVTGNEGYRIIWGTVSHAGQLSPNAANPYTNSQDVATDITTYAAGLGAGTYFWRVAVLINESPQEWPDEATFTI